MKKLLKIFTGVGGWIFTIICCGVIIGSVATLLIFDHYTKDLPDHSALAEYNPPTMTRIYARDGRLITEYAKEKRIYAPLRTIPQPVIHAFLSAEDKNFYSHTGIDYRGIARAVLTNLTNFGENKGLVGGSTITQQVVKNFLLTNERSLRRKIREAVLAIRITNVYSKDQILELYLNEIFLGHRSYGIAAAAMNYFNRSLNELTLEEAALLAALPKAPSELNPHKNYDRAMERRNWVLERMYEDSRISLAELQQARNKPIILRKRDAQETVDAPYFAAEVKRFLKETLGEKVVNEGGLSVVTTLDPELQVEADNALRAQLVTYDRRRGYRGGVGRLDDVDTFAAQLPGHEARRMLVDGQQLAVVLNISNSEAQIGLSDGSTGVIPLKLLSWSRRVIADGQLGPPVNTPGDILSVGDVIIVGAISEKQRKLIGEEQAKVAWDLQQVPLVNGGMVAANPHSGKILAMSGGYSHRVSSFNRATQAKRQPGSVFKPFVYLSALEHGMTPSTRVLDGRIELSNVGGEAWRPENYGDTYLGPTTLRKGLEKSRNTMTVRLGQALGMSRIMEVGKRFGVYDDVPQPNLSMVLGTLETTVMRVLNGYAVLANGGRIVAPIMVERVEDRHGNVLYQRDLRGCPTCVVDDANWNPQSLSPPALFDPRERIVDARVAYQMVSLLEGVVARGTAASAASLPWALGGKTGTTNESRDTWFMGISPDLVAGVFIGFDTPAPLGSKYTGSSMALPVFKDFMSAALEGTAKKEFASPSGLQRVKVDAQTGLPIQPWEDDGRNTMWETMLRADIPMFKTDSALAVGELAPDSASKLGMEEYMFETYGITEDTLPWQQGGGAGVEGDRSFDGFPSYYSRHPVPPSGYIPPNPTPPNGGQNSGLPPYPRQGQFQDPRGVYIPQIGAPERAPQRRHGSTPAAPSEAPRDGRTLY